MAIESILAGVQRAWSVGSFPGVDAVYTGEESTAIRAGDLVVRVGPTWRTSAEADWCYALADRLGDSCPEVVRPIRTGSGAPTVRIDDRPVSLWPWVDGQRGDRHPPRHRHEAAAVLASLHAAAAELSLPARPPMGATTDPVAAFEDRHLDDWLADFTRDRSTHALHGDYYPGNLLFDEDRLVAIIDWDEARVGPPEAELAVAACEWGNVLRTGDLTRAVEFVDVYDAHGGTADKIDANEISQLYRARLRWELAYEEHHRGPLESLDSDDRIHRERQIALFHDLRVR